MGELIDEISDFAKYLDSQSKEVWDWESSQDYLQSEEKDSFTIVKEDPAASSAILEIIKSNVSRGKVDETPITNTEFQKRGFISGETWASSTNLHARISKIMSDEIYCECVLDKDEKVFEIRSFPKNLFEHIENLTEKHPIIINIRNKPGSSRIDIYNGEHLVDKSLFDLKDGWESLRESGLDKEFKLIDD